MSVEVLIILPYPARARTLPHRCHLQLLAADLLYRRAVLGGELLEGASLTEMGSRTLSSFAARSDIGMRKCAGIGGAIRECASALFIFPPTSRQPIAYAVVPGRMSR